LNGDKNMDELSNQKAAIIQTERGLSISGTRITIFDVMYYLKAQYPPKFIRDSFDLTDEQIGAALSYIETHPEEVEAEYQEMLKSGEEIRQYWEERNRDRFARIAANPPSAGSEAVRLKLLQNRMLRESKKQ
jgi:uncharacterized protein (DUF433 family)